MQVIYITNTHVCHSYNQQTCMTYIQATNIHDIQNLEITVNEFGYKIMKNVPYDGNCFFNDIAELTGESGVDLRKSVTEFV